MCMKALKIKCIFVFMVLFFISITAQSYPIKNNLVKTNTNKHKYTVYTEDGVPITLIHYEGCKKPSILLIPGYSCNHRIYDMDDNHSLAKFLNRNDWDVWIINLRTHDGDGDFWFDPESDREFINKYWDFDCTYLKKDVVRAVSFIKNISSTEKLFLIGHSMGGYLCYAYAELISQKDLAGIVAIGSSPFANPRNFSILLMLRFGIKIGKRVFVNPFGSQRVHFSKFYTKRVPIPDPKADLFYKNTTSKEIQLLFHYSCDDEPAGIYVDMIWGRDQRFYNGHWVDPQTLYDYTENLDKITVPFLGIAGDEDTLQDPKEDMFKGFEMISSEEKDFMSFANYSHCDLLLGDNADIQIFPYINSWLDQVK